MRHCSQATSSQADRLDAGEEAGTVDGGSLLRLAHGIKLGARVRKVGDLLRLGEDTNAAADGNGSVLEVVSPMLRGGD
jgi:hypothetical protein